MRRTQNMYKFKKAPFQEGPNYTKRLVTFFHTNSSIKASFISCDK